MTYKQLKNMANRMKLRRKELHYTQEHTAELLGITLSSYSKIENAFQKPSLDTLIKVSEQLNLSLDYLVFGVSKEAPVDDDQEVFLRAIIDFIDPEKIQHVDALLHAMAKLKMSQ